MIKIECSLPDDYLTPTLLSEIVEKWRNEQLIKEIDDLVNKMCPVHYSQYASYAEEVGYSNARKDLKKYLLTEAMKKNGSVDS